jgi:hypothetical protein
MLPVKSDAAAAALRRLCQVCGGAAAASLEPPCLLPLLKQVPVNTHLRPAVCTPALRRRDMRGVEGAERCTFWAICI